jgi:hypothetical protein
MVLITGAVRIRWTEEREVRMTRYRDQVALVAVVLAPFAVCAALVPLRTTSFAGTNSALVLVVVAVAIAINGRRLAGALSAMSAATRFDFLLAQPV